MAEELGELSPEEIAAARERVKRFAEEKQARFFALMKAFRPFTPERPDPHSIVEQNDWCMLTLNPEPKKEDKIPGAWSRYSLEFKDMGILPAHLERMVTDLAYEILQGQAILQYDKLCVDLTRDEWRELLEHTNDFNVWTFCDKGACTLSKWYAQLPVDLAFVEKGK